MKVIIAGSRDWNNAQILAETMAKFMAKFPNQITEVVSGCAPGADKLGELWAEWKKLPVKPFAANWSAYGRKAGPLRNAHMANYADALVAFRCAGESPGTDDMVKQAKARNLIVWVVNPKGEIQVFSAQLDLFAK